MGQRAVTLGSVDTPELIQELPQPSLQGGRAAGPGYPHLTWAQRLGGPQDTELPFTGIAKPAAPTQFSFYNTHLVPDRDLHKQAYIGSWPKSVSEGELQTFLPQTE